jgi:hypothetical protein
MGTEMHRKRSENKTWKREERNSAAYSQKVELSMASSRLWTTASLSRVYPVIALSKYDVRAETQKKGVSSGATERRNTKKKKATNIFPHCKHTGFQKGRAKRRNNSITGLGICKTKTNES